MNFHLEFSPKPFAQKIKHHHTVLLTGSCFTENIGTKLKQFKFGVLENPNGILFNPVSIAQSLQSYIHNRQYTEADLFYQNESWNSWQHHTRFSHPDKAVCLQRINQSQQAAHQFLKTANWVLITVGSAFVYEFPVSTSGDSCVVANCHKVPTDKFTKRLLGIDEIKKQFQEMLEHLFGFNPGVQVIFTISPVRHLRDGFVENNRSKAALIQAIHQLTDMDERLFYFPAYELVIDDLRDYRFYAEDMVHPNYAATNYVWEKFISTCIDEIKKRLQEMLERLFDFNPGVQVIFTISPVRHLRDGFVENNRSKAALIQAIHQLTDMDERLFYFPAYELVIDDLRDYRFYAEDMVHPNYAATNYVWEKFISTCIDETSQALMKEINVINAAKSHKPFNPTSEQHRKFLQSNLEKVMLLEKQYGYIDFREEKQYFTDNR